MDSQLTERNKMREAYHQEDYTKKNTYTITTISQKITCKNVTYARMLELLAEGGITPGVIVSYHCQVNTFR